MPSDESATKNKIHLRWCLNVLDDWMVWMGGGNKFHTLGAVTENS